jgi:hypothetical protein
MKERVKKLRLHPVMARKVGIIQRICINGVNYLPCAKFIGSPRALTIKLSKWGMMGNFRNTVLGQRKILSLVV